MTAVVCIPRRLPLARWGVLATLALAAGAPAHAESLPAPPAPLPLAWCLERAEQANPMLASDEAAADAARARIVPAGSLEDPRFGYEASNLPVGEIGFDSTPLSGHQLTLSQKLPFPGLLHQREKAARKAADAAGAGVEDRRQRVRAAVETAWAQLGFAQRAVDITDRNVELVRQLARIAETKYSVGTGLQQDVLRAQVQLTRLHEQRLVRAAQVGRSEAAVAALLDLPPQVALPRTADLADDAPLPELSPLVDGLEQTSPVLRALAARVEQAERTRRAARLEGLPDLDLGLGYRIREKVPGDPVNGDDFVAAGVRVRLPINRSRWNAEVAHADALLRKARADRRSGLASLREQVRSRYADLVRADAEYVLLRDGLVPQTRQSLESSRSGYEVDKVDFLSLIDSQVRLLEAELRMVQAAADRRAAFAALEAAVGESLR